MSQFLGFASALIPANSTPSYNQATFSSILTSYNWQIVRQAVLPTSIIGTFTNLANAMDLQGANSTTTTSLPAYIGVNIAAGFTPVNMYITSDNQNWVNQSPMTFTLDYSSNGSSWTTLQSFSNQINWGACEKRKYAITSATSQTYWRLNVTAANSGSTCYIGEWCLEDANGNWLTNVSFFDCIPPTTETIGDSNTRDILRWTFPSAGTSIWLNSVQETFITYPQILNFFTSTAGAVTNSITINGSTVSFTGSTGNTSGQNDRGLYEACRSSSNANFTAFNWVWFQVHVGNSSPGFLAIQKTPAMNILPTVSNINLQIRGMSVYNVPLVQGSQCGTVSSLTIDNYNGWIYFMQICSRGIAIGSKTSSAYYTPVHACYGDNAQARAQVPTSDLAAYGIPCTIIELIVGFDNAITTTDGYGYGNHTWGVAMGHYYSSSTGFIDAAHSNTNSTALFTHHYFSGMLQDFSTDNTWLVGSSYRCGSGPFQLSGEGIFQSTDGGGTGYSIHKLKCTPNAINSYTSGYQSSYYMRNTGPIFSTLDWYKYCGTAPANEQLIVSLSTDFTTTISTTGTSIDTVINVASTTGFPSSGWLAIDGEIISYTGITSTSFTGCTRGAYNTYKIALFPGTTVYIGAWFVFLVCGLIFAGYQTPS